MTCPSPNKLTLLRVGGAKREDGLRALSLPYPLFAGVQLLSHLGVVALGLLFGGI